MKLKFVLGESYSDEIPASEEQIKEAKFVKWLTMMEL